MNLNWSGNEAPFYSRRPQAKSEHIFLFLLKVMASGGKRVSCGLDFISPADITNALQVTTEAKYVFLPFKTYA